MKYESGVHRVQRVPETESGGRIHTSTITVAVMPEAEDVDIQIDEKDIRIDVMRASGNGGQCVNTTDSAVRLTHYPTKRSLFYARSYMIWNARNVMMQKQKQERARSVPETDRKRSVLTTSHRDV